MSYRLGMILTASMLFLGVFVAHVWPVECSTDIPVCEPVPGPLHIILATMGERS